MLNRTSPNPAYRQAGSPKGEEQHTALEGKCRYITDAAIMLSRIHAAQECDHSTSLPRHFVGAKQGNPDKLSGATQLLILRQCSVENRKMNGASQQPMIVHGMLRIVMQLG